MINAKQIWKETAKQLEKVYEVREAENISYLIMEDVFGISKTAILAEDDIVIDEMRLKSVLQRLLNHEPVQYVTGVADFFGRKFSVASGVLIPRPETEELCDWIIQDVDKDETKILDIGTGSGCIAITLALALDAEVMALDVSEDALAIAKQNAESLKANVHFYKHDILKADLLLRDLDAIVSNPPYIPEQERRIMDQNVTNHEPHLALFVPQEDPLLFYKIIAEKGLKALKPNGKLYFEIHEHYGAEITALLENMGYTGVTISKDMQGKDRMIGAVKS